MDPLATLPVAIPLSRKDSLSLSMGTLSRLGPALTRSVLRHIASPKLKKLFLASMPKELERTKNKKLSSSTLETIQVAYTEYFTSSVFELGAPADGLFSPSGLTKSPFSGINPTEASAHSDALIQYLEGLCVTVQELLVADKSISDRGEPSDSFWTALEAEAGKAGAVLPGMPRLSAGRGLTRPHAAGFARFIALSSLTWIAYRLWQVPSLQIAAQRCLASEVNSLATPIKAPPGVVGDVTDRVLAAIAVWRLTALSADINSTVLPWETDLRSDITSPTDVAAAAKLKAFQRTLLDVRARALRGVLPHELSSAMEKSWAAELQASTDPAVFIRAESLDFIIAKYRELLAHLYSATNWTSLWRGILGVHRDSLRGARIAQLVVEGTEPLSSSSFSSGASSAKSSSRSNRSRGRDRGGERHAPCLRCGQNGHRLNRCTKANSVTGKPPSPCAGCGGDHFDIDCPNGPVSPSRRRKQFEERRAKRGGQRRPPLRPLLAAPTAIPTVPFHPSPDTHPRPGNWRPPPTARTPRTSLEMTTHKRQTFFPPQPRTGNVPGMSHESGELSRRAAELLVNIR